MLQILIAGGWLMLPIVMCSVIGVGIVIERQLLYFRGTGKISEANQMVTLFEQGKFTDCTGPCGAARSTGVTCLGSWHYKTGRTS